jgi:hypothetical protein
MKLVKEFNLSVQERAKNDPAYREALLDEAVRLLRAGKRKMGAALVMKYVRLAEQLCTPETQTGTTDGRRPD